jgi:hypothetical protein
VRGKQRRQNSNDSDDRQQFNQCKSAFCPHAPFRRAGSATHSSWFGRNIVVVRRVA